MNPSSKPSAKMRLSSRPFSVALLMTPRRVASAGVHHGISRATLHRRIRTLGLHECLYKSFGVAGEIVRGQPFYELLKR